MSTTKQVQDPVQTPSFYPDPVASDIDDDDTDGEDEGKDVQTPSFFPDPMDFDIEADSDNDDTDGED